MEFVNKAALAEWLETQPLLVNKDKFILANDSCVFVMTLTYDVTAIKKEIIEYILNMYESELVVYHAGDAISVRVDDRFITTGSSFTLTELKEML